MSVFFTASLVAESPRKNPLAYGELAVGRGVYAYADEDPISLVDPLGLWCWGESIPNRWFNFSVGIADGLSFDLGRVARYIVENGGGVDTDSSEYRAGLYTGLASQAAIAGYGAATSPQLGSFARAAYVSGQLIVGGASITGASDLPPVIESIYQAGEVTSEQQIENIQQAIETVSKGGTW